MHQHKDEIQIEIVIFKQNLDSLSDIEKLETQLIKELKPIWNNQNTE